VGLRRRPSIDGLEVVGIVGFEQPQRVGSVMLATYAREEVGITCRDDAVDREPPSMTMVGVQTVPSPRIMADDHGRSYFADHTTHDLADGRAALEFAVDESAEMDRGVGQGCRRGGCFGDACRDEG